MIELNVNGKTQSVDADPDTPLLYVLRDHLALNGAKFGCGLGQCGACTVMVDGDAVFSCLTPICGAGRAQDQDRRRTGHDREPRPAAARVHRRAGGAMRLLHRRHDHARAGAAGEESFAVGCRDSPPHDAQPVPLRDADAHPSRRSPCGAMRCRLARQPSTAGAAHDALRRRIASAFAARLPRCDRCADRRLFACAVVSRLRNKPAGPEACPAVSTPIRCSTRGSASMPMAASPCSPARPSWGRASRPR